MKIKTLRNLGAGWPTLTEGQEADVPRDVGVKLVAAGLAIELACDQPAVIQAVPAPAEFNTSPVIEQQPIVAEIAPAREPEPTEENTAPDVPAEPTDDTETRSHRNRGRK